MGLFGDLNGDGKVDAKDIALLKMVIESDPDIANNMTPEERALLDVNQDGQVDRDDLTALCSRLMMIASTQSHEKIHSLREKLAR